jgi:putative membrane protein
MIRTLSFVAIAALATSASAQVVIQVPPGDEYFAMRAYAAGLAEVAKSQLAYERATQKDIKDFAEKMIRDHTDCNNKIVEVARRKGMALPATIDAVQSAMIARLSRMAGSDFDKTYMMAQACAHEAAIRLFERESCKGEDSDLKELATKAIPTLEDHAKRAFELAGDKAEYQKFCKVLDYAKQLREKPGDSDSNRSRDGEINRTGNRDDRKNDRDRGDARKPE